MSSPGIAIRVALYIGFHGLLLNNDSGCGVDDDCPSDIGVHVDAVTNDDGIIAGDVESTLELSETTGDEVPGEHLLSEHFGDEPPVSTLGSNVINRCSFTDLQNHFAAGCDAREEGAEKDCTTSAASDSLESIQVAKRRVKRTVRATKFVASNFH